MATSASLSPFPRTPSTASISNQGERKASWTPQTRNPVSLRLYKVLSTNFDDEETRQALNTLSDLYATPLPPPPTTSTKGKSSELQPQTVTVDDRDEEQALHDADMASTPVTATSAVLVEVVPGESAARARKNLRRDMENQLAEGSRRFLEALGEVDAVCCVSFFVARSYAKSFFVFGPFSLSLSLDIFFGLEIRGVAEACGSDESEL